MKNEEQTREKWGELNEWEEGGVERVGEGIREKWAVKGAGVGKGLGGTGLGCKVEERR